MTNIELMYFVFVLNVMVIVVTYCKLDALGFSSVTSLMHGNDTVKGSLGCIATRCGDALGAYAGVSCILTIGITLYGHQWIWLAIGLLSIVISFSPIVGSTACLRDNLEFLRKGYAGIHGMRDIKVIIIPLGVIKWLYLINLAFMIVQLLRGLLL